jgi:hypothetical protein
LKFVQRVNPLFIVANLFFKERRQHCGPDTELFKVAQRIGIARQGSRGRDERVLER